MKLSLLFGAAILTVTSIFSQDYQVINSKSYKIFSVPGEKYQNESFDFKRSLKVDSVHLLGEESVFYFSKEIGYLGDENGKCFTPKGNSFLGKLAKIDQAGNTVFLNFFKDSVLIKTQAVHNESWICFQKGDTSVTGTVVSHQLETVLGKQDSVKIISFTYAIKGVSSSHGIDSVNVKLSKTYGLVQAVNLNFFPNVPSYYKPFLSVDITPVQDFPYRTHQLVGMSNPRLGLQNPSKKDLYDFNVGDEFHFVGGHNRNLSCQCTDVLNDTTIDRIIGKNISGDSIVYKIAYRYKSSLTYKGVTTRTDIYDTVNFTVFQEMLIDALPYTPVSITEPSMLQYNMLIDSLIKKKSDLHLSSNASSSNSIYCEFSHHTQISETYNGCYLDRNPTNSESYGAATTHRCVYYKSKCGEWGSKIVLGTQKIEVLDFAIFPNPSTGSFQITSQDNISSVQIFDQHGRVVKTVPGNDAKVLFTDINDSGIFTVEVNSNNKIGYSKVVVVK